ncbi:MAG: YCF48-related protein [Melioribacteraceae bacterium]|nr:YCF48-related protein [Melioribacteraceae bacterium]
MKLIKYFYLLFFVLLCNQSIISQNISETNLYDLDFVDSSNGYMLVSGYQFVKTTDGGETWKLLPTKFDEWINNFQFPSVDTGYATNYYSNVLFRTINGGNTWDSIGVFENEIREMEFVDSKVGFITGANNSKNIYKTQNAGLNWYPLFTGSNQFSTSDIEVIEENNIYVTSWCCDLAKSTDGGENWEINSTILMVMLSFQDMLFVNSEVGFIYGLGIDPFTREGDYPIIGRTTDGGENWETRYFKKNTSISDFYFNDKNNGWILTRNKIFYSTDNFITKDSIDIPLHRFVFLSDSLSYGITENLFYKSSDGWKTFEELHDFTTDVKDNTYPKTFSLSQNYPNPFNPETTIEFSIPQSGQVKLELFDILGRIMVTYIDEYRAAGTYELQLNLSDYSSGIYIYKISFERMTISKKLLLMK